MRLAAALVAVLASSSWAWPVDWIHDVPVGREKFVKLPHLDWFDVEDSSVVKVEWLADSEELLLTAVKPGRALVLLGAQGKVAVWRVRVGGAPQRGEAALASATKACAGLVWAPEGDVKLTVAVKDEPCRVSLTSLFQTDAVEARHLELTFEAPVLRTQLTALQKAFEGIAPRRVASKYVGAGLVLEGRVTPAEHRRLLWAIARNTLGAVVVDDQLVVDEADAGP